MKTKQILLIDMDGVIADFRKAIIENSDISIEDFDNHTNDAENRVDQFCIQNTTIFENLQPIENAIESVTKLFDYYDIYFCSTPMYLVPESYKSKRIWLEKHFGELASRRLILTHRKDLIKGDILIDDRKVNGVENFDGLFIHFGVFENSTNWDICFKSLMLHFQTRSRFDKNSLKPSKKVLKALGNGQ